MASSMAFSMSMRLVVHQSCGVFILFIHAIDDQERRFAWAKPLDGKMAQRTRNVAQSKDVVQHAGRGVLAPDVVQSDFLPAVQGPLKMPALFDKLLALHVARDHGQHHWILGTAGQ